MPQPTSPWPLRLLLDAPRTLLVYPFPDDRHALQGVRQLRGLTQEEVGRALCLQRDVIAKYEARANPRLGTVQDIIGALGGNVIVIAQFPGWGCIDMPFPREGGHPQTPDAAAAVLHTAREH